MRDHTPRTERTRAPNGRMSSAHPRVYDRPGRAAPFRRPQLPRRMAGAAPTPAPRRPKATHEFEGTLRLTSKGLGFVTVEGRDEDIEIDPAFLATGLDKDRVRVLLHPLVAGRRQGGEVAEILSREKTRFVGILEREHGRMYLVPDDARMYRDILIPSDKSAGAKLGEKVLVAITHWDDPRHDPLGEVITRIGTPGEHETEIQAIVLERGLDATFPKEVAAAADAIPTTIDPAEIARRKDMRSILTCTIDPKDAKDFDDALSFQTLPDGTYEVGVHIADVSHYVHPGDTLDREARARATSVYLVDRTIPMLPERLSNGLCSLVPNEDRLAFSAIFRMDRTGAVLEEWFGRTVIHSAFRYTYETAQEAIETGTGALPDALRTLRDISKVLRKDRLASGAIEFESREVRFTLDERGRPIDVYEKTMLETNKLIEEFMLLANRRVAGHVKEKDPESKRVFLYRVHKEPAEEKLRDLVEFLRGIGEELPLSDDGRVSGKDLNALFARIATRSEARLIHIAAIRSMAKAIYATENIGHFGLNFSHYTHFTSPIRRYPDVLVHRLLAAELTGKPTPKKALEELEMLARYSTEMEIAAAEAERASIKYKQCEYWKEREGMDWHGTISGVTEWGFYVEDEHTRTEGLVPARDIPDDFYVLEEKHYRLVGKNTGRIFRLGDPVTVTVVSVDVKKRQITLALKDTEKE